MQINDTTTQVLLDTCAQVVPVSKKLKENLIDVKISEAEELLEPCYKLRVGEDNRAEITFVGWRDIKFEHIWSTTFCDNTQQIHVSFFVIREPLECSILGLNAVKQLVNNIWNNIDFISLLQKI